MEWNPFFTTVAITLVLHGHLPPPEPPGLSLIADTAGSLGLALRALSERDRDAVKAGVDGSLARFAAERGYEIPDVALCAVAG